MNIKRVVVFVVILFVNALVFAEPRNMVGKVIIFDNAEKDLLVLNLDSKEKLNSVNVSEQLRNPALVISANQDIVSLHEHFGESDYVVNLNTGLVSYKPGVVGTVVASEDKKFYFEMVSVGTRRLFFESGGNKESLTDMKILKVPRGHVVGNEAVSWFIRSEHRLISFDFNGEQLLTIQVDCRDAIYLGKRNIFCLKESGEAVVVDMEGKELKVLEGLGVKDSLLAYSYERNEIYFARKSLSFKLNSFMTEIIDLYSYDLVTDDLVLVKKHIANHGASLGIIL
ncbi:hypothetical protein [Shewanella woodyi]|uniref:hypothetical protein n=1 Tax=Shewanella woodyi TaxID=60961 RepID=UPI0007F8BFCF|nr:hypothetical protein [Shewanella woodyi]